MLQTIKWVILISMLICVFWLVIKIFSKKSVKKIGLWCCLSGVVSLVILVILSQKTEPILPINAYTLGTSCLLGIPGIILLLLTKILWQLS